MTLSLKKHPGPVPTLVQVESPILAAKEAKTWPHSHSQKGLIPQKQGIHGGSGGVGQTLLSFSTDEKTEAQRS